MKRNVAFQDGKIWIDGVETRILSGAMHYFRTRPEQWRDRMTKAVDLGLNAIETYFCWNLHEPQPGVWDTTGLLDFEQFCRTAAELGLFVIARPGPYICAEWDNGGIPPWVGNLPGVKVRRTNPAFQNAVKNYLDRLLPQLAPLQYTRGGNVIAVQIENEYGSYGEDQHYLEWLRRQLLDGGIEVPLFTADGGGPYGFLLGGSLPGVPAALTFGPGDVDEVFRRSRELHPEGPDLAMEYWIGAFAHWGEKHATVAIDAVTASLDRMLELGASVNFYMFHGGTNFGFQNGANLINRFEGSRLKDASVHALDYAPDVTSYDYDALLSEAGDPTAKYFAVQQVLRKHFPNRAYGTPTAGRKRAYGEVELTGSAALFEQLPRLGTRRETRDARSMESFGQNTGFILYRTRIPGPVVGVEEAVRLFGVRDRAQIYADDRYLGSVYRNEGDRCFELDLDAGGCQLDVLVENLGHVNYGPAGGDDPKGLLGGVAVRCKMLSDYEVWPLPLDEPGVLEFGAVAAVNNRPRFFRGVFVIDEVADTYLRFPGCKGVVWINGTNIGRYWEIGPGDTLYVPYPLLRAGENEIIVLELHDLKRFAVEFVAAADLTHTPS